MLLFDIRSDSFRNEGLLLTIKWGRWYNFFTGGWWWYLWGGDDIFSFYGEKILEVRSSSFYELPWDRGILVSVGCFRGEWRVRDSRTGKVWWEAVMLRPSLWGGIFWVPTLTTTFLWFSVAHSSHRVLWSTYFSDHYLHCCLKSPFPPQEGSSSDSTPFL